MIRFTSILSLALFLALFCAFNDNLSGTVSLAEATEVDDDGETLQAGTLRDDAPYDDDDDDDDIEVGNDEDDYPEEDGEEGDGATDDGLGAQEPGDAASEPDKPAVIDPPGDEKAKYAAPNADGAVFFDSFQDGLSQWTHSSEAGYNGEFVTGQGAKPTIRGDRALIIPEKARKYGLSSNVKGLENLSDKDVVIQYELKMEEGVTCGGAYIKLPLPGFTPPQLTGDTPYSIMFGPDKCGATDKVHFIFQSENPVSGKRTEHHLMSPPSIANSYDKKTHLYTLIVRKDATFELLVDMEKKSYGSLTDKFDPPIQPEEKIDDPDDKKPDDWVDEKKIVDPDATKPDDWDEDAPKQIVDEDAEKPEGWLDDEPEKIADPSAKKPDGWDEEEDGEWEAPMISNPKCQAVGCGEWTKPMKANPDYKGKWKAPLIDNPKYIGEWSPKKIDNPDYYKVEKAQLLGIGGVAFEIWTMDQGVLFDNLYIGTDETAAQGFANATFSSKQKIELEREEAERKKEEAEAAKKEKAAKKGRDNSSKMGKTLGPVMDKVEDLIEKVEKVLEPLEAWLQKKGMEPYLDRMIDMGIKKPMIVVVLMPLTITFLILALLGGGKKEEEEEEASVATETTEAMTDMDASEKKKTDAETKDVDAEEEDEAEEEEIDTKEGEENGIESTGLRHRPRA